MVYQLPVQRRVRGGPLHLRVTLRRGGVVLRRHRPLLGAEGLRGVQAHLLDRLRVGPARRREGVAQPGDPGGDGADGLRGDDAGQGVCPDVPGLPAADPVGGAERGPLRRAPPDHPVAEAELSPPVRLRLHHELGREAVAVEQVTLRDPGLVLPFQEDAGTHPAQVDLERGAGGTDARPACR